VSETVGVPNVTDARLAEWERLLAELNPTEWRQRMAEDGDCDAGPDGRTISWSTGEWVETEEVVEVYGTDVGKDWHYGHGTSHCVAQGYDVAYAALIVAAVNALPLLIAEVRRLRDAVSDACGIIEIGDQRLLASDGPVNNMPPEITLAEWKEMYSVLNGTRSTHLRGGRSGDGG
jgi:hypothetical protein